MSFVLKVWLAILVGPILLWLGAIALAAILANLPQTGDGQAALVVAIVSFLTLLWWLTAGRKKKTNENPEG